VSENQKDRKNGAEGVSGTYSLAKDRLGTNGGVEESRSNGQRAVQKGPGRREPGSATAPRSVTLEDQPFKGTANQQIKERGTGSTGSVPARDVTSVLYGRNKATEQGRGGKALESPQFFQSADRCASCAESAGDSKEKRLAKREGTIHQPTAKFEVTVAYDLIGRAVAIQVKKAYGKNGKVSRNEWRRDREEDGYAAWGAKMGKEDGFLVGKNLKARNPGEKEQTRKGIHV